MMHQVHIPSRRRGGLTDQEIKQIYAERAKPRPTPWQHIAQQMGRPVETIQAVFQ